jgi:DNA polymerase
MEGNNCTDCDLCDQRKNIVYPRGSANPKIIFIGEAPGSKEDATGKPFVGRSGKLLDEWIAYLGLKEGDYSITNIVWCRPPENRYPMPDEVIACRKHLDDYLSRHDPLFIVTLGRLAASNMIMSNNVTLSLIVGKFSLTRPKVYFLYHPAYFLRNHEDWKPSLEALKERLRCKV